MKLSEQLIEQCILKWLNLQIGCFAFKQDVRGVWNVKRRFFQKATPGVPVGGSDIIGCYRGRFFALEVKTPLAYKTFINSRKLHALKQQAFLSTVIKAGGEAHVVCSLEQVQELFKKWNPVSETM